MNSLIKPIVTEKAASNSELLNRFSFVVRKSANKVEIKKDVEAVYGVSVVKVRTMIVRADRKTKFTKTGVVSGKKSAYKKAIIQLPEGETIDLYSNL